jgi:glycosyltransferase involved in cell wall biosynthesis
MFERMIVAVVVPAFNEADKIEHTIRSVPAYVDHIVVVDDGSTDGTARVAAAARAAQGRPGIEIVRHAGNRGVGGAIATGYRQALRSGAHAIAVMAGDAQMDPRDLSALLAPLSRGVADYAKGNRFLSPDVRRVMPPLRYLGNVVLSHLTRLTSGYPRVFDSQCGYTAISRRALLAIDPEQLFPRYGYPNDLLSRLAQVQARVVDVPVRPVYGPGWRSGIGVRSLLSIGFVLLRALLRLGRWKVMSHARRRAHDILPARTD